MTFKESEFPNLIPMMDTVVNQYPPEAVSAFIREMVRIYKAIPLYPGLVCMCLGKAFQPWKPEDPAPRAGSLLVIRLKGSHSLAGKLTAWTPASVQIEVSDSAGKSKRVKLQRRRIDRIETFRSDTLEKYWPTLVFDQKPSPARKAARR